MRSKRLPRKRKDRRQPRKQRVKFPLFPRLPPVLFCLDADVIAEEAARFRALSPAKRVQSIRGLLAAGARMMRRSPKAAFRRSADSRVGQGSGGATSAACPKAKRVRRTSY